MSDDHAGLRVLDGLERELVEKLYRRDRAAGRIRAWLPEWALRVGWWPLGGLGAVSVAALVLVLVLVSSGGVTTSPAVAALDRAAATVQRGPGTPVLRAGQFWYTRTSGYVTGMFFVFPRGWPAHRRPPSVTFLWPATEELWVGRDGTERFRATYGKVRIPAAKDRATFARYGHLFVAVDDVQQSDQDSIIQGDGFFPPTQSPGSLSQERGLFSYQQLLALPTDPKALYKRIDEAVIAQESRIFKQYRQAAHGAVRQLSKHELAVERASSDLFAIAGLLQSPAPTAVKAALYRAAALIPGVRLRAARGALGHHDVAVYIGKWSYLQLVFDPTTGAVIRQDNFLQSGSLSAVAAGAVNSIYAIPRGVARIPSRAPTPMPVTPISGTAHTSSPQPLQLGRGISGQVAPLGFALSANDDGIIALMQSCPCSDARRGERYLMALTADGGRTWTLAGDPPGLGAPQLSGRDGWAEGGTRTAFIHFYVTHDDGRHWALAPGAVPSPGPSAPSIADGEVWSFSGCVHGCGVTILHAPVSASRLTATAAQPIPDNHNNTQVLAAGPGSAYVLRRVFGNTAASTLFVTHDDGRSWRRLPPLYCANGQLSLATPTVLYAVCQPDSQQTAEMIRSTDGGLHWLRVATEPEGLTLVPAGRAVLWAITSQMQFPPVVSSKVIRSTDGGVHWQAMFNVPRAPGQVPGSYVNSTLIANGPSSADLLVSATRGGTHGHAPTTALVVYRTADAGRSWTLSAIR
jgi:photosystem II stability/assembly factor-like uncharacterized protein